MSRPLFVDTRRVDGHSPPINAQHGEHMAAMTLAQYTAENGNPLRTPRAEHPLNDKAVRICAGAAAQCRFGGVSLKGGGDAVGRVWAVVGDKVVCHFEAVGQCVANLSDVVEV